MPTTIAHKHLATVILQIRDPWFKYLLVVVLAAPPCPPSSEGFHLDRRILPWCYFVASAPHCVIIVAGQYVSWAFVRFLFNAVPCHGLCGQRGSPSIFQHVRGQYLCGCAARELFGVVM